MAETNVASEATTPIPVQDESLLERVLAETAQDWAIAVKDVRVYYA